MLGEQDRTEMKITSKERLWRAICRQPVDHIPLLLRFWSIGGQEDNIPFPWQDQVSRCENTLARGLDDTLLLEPPLGYVENYSPDGLAGVTCEIRRDPSNPRGSYPLLTKIYHTPEGPLQTTVKLTEDWPWGEDIHLFDDYNIPRIVEPLIKTSDDLSRLVYLLGEPGESQINKFKVCAHNLRDHANRLGVILDGGWTALGDSAMWLCGMQRILYAQTDEPEFVEAVLDTIFTWEMHRMDWVIQEGIDVIVHSAWYEGTDFWSPRNYRRYLKPRLNQMIVKAHDHGKKFRYIITKGWKPLREDLIEIGVDCITGIDPVQDRVDLVESKQSIGHRVCLMGGVNSAVLFAPESDDSLIRQAVEEAMKYLAPGNGFVLYPVDAIFNNQPWEKIEVFIDHWKEICDQMQSDSTENEQSCLSN
jgi:Uroporphyrinogen decarboxylase (URO-D)